MSDGETELNKWRKLARLGIEYDFEIARLEERLVILRETRDAIWFAVNEHPESAQIKREAKDAAPME